MAEPSPSKLTTAKQLKEAGDIAFKEKRTKDALRSYHSSLLYLQGLDKSALQSMGLASEPAPSKDGEAAKEKTEVDDMIEKIYANQAACHIREKNWQRAVETADKALKKNENNYKAMYRKGQALGEQGFFERAKKVLEELKSKSAADAAAATAEIARLKHIDDAREKINNKKLKGFLNKAVQRGETLEVQKQFEEVSISEDPDVIEISSPEVSKSR